MNHSLRSGADVARLLAADIGKRLTQRTIRTLQGMKEPLLSGPDSGLATVWDEICAQVQFEQSYYWELYDATAHQCVAGLVAELKEYEQFALWLQSEAGWSWEWDLEHGQTNESDRPEFLLDDVIDYVVSDFIYKAAGQWQNRRIRTYIDRQW